MPNNYQPVSCQLHSEIELHAINGTRVKIEMDADDMPIIGQIIDISIHDKAEYVTIKTTSQQLKEIRLDKIQAMTPL
jgi:transcriptional antiterminator Rof (Rho-off)